MGKNNREYFTDQSPSTDAIQNTSKRFPVSAILRVLAGTGTISGKSTASYNLTVSKMFFATQKVSLINFFLAEMYFK